MATKNSLVQEKPKFSAFVRQENVQKMIHEVIGGKDKDRFITSIVSSVSQNPALQDCDFPTIISSALQGQALGLSPSPVLGQFYMVPFKDNRNRRTVAQFQIGYKGYIQLAMRSGQYRKLNVIEIKEGELKNYDPLNEDIQAIVIEDPTERENAKTIGYYAMFELTNGFRKTMFWSYERMQAHAKQYSKSYASDLRNNTQYTFWSKDFDGMAYKTMLRQLISKWGPMEIDMQTAVESDMQVINTDGSREYADGIETEFSVVEPDPESETPVAHKVEFPSDLPFEQQSDIEQEFFGG